MDTTAEATHELRQGDPAELTLAPAGPDQQYRVVLDWRDSPTVASVPITDRRTALAAFDRAVKLHAADLADDQLRVSVLAEDVWTARGTQPGSRATTPDPAAGR